MPNEAEQRRPGLLGDTLVAEIMVKVASGVDEGHLDDEEIICPGHGFMFNVKTGVCLNHPGFSVRSYKVKLEGEKVLVELN